MKKNWALLALSVIAAAQGFAVDFPPVTFSAGAGGFLGYTFTRYYFEGGRTGGGDVKSTQVMDRFDFGGFLFVDATYAELSVVIQGGSNSYQEVMKTRASEYLPRETVTDGRGTGTEMTVGLSLLGKYPFRIYDTLTLFPLLGIEYHFALIEWRKPEGKNVYDRTWGKLPEDLDKDSQPYPASAWNSFWIDAGCGADWDFAERWFLRGELLFGVRLQTVYETGALEMAKNQFGVGDVTLGGLTGSPRLKIGAGYRF
jgi:hypothetical protein